MRDEFGVSFFAFLLLEIDIRTIDYRLLQNDQLLKTMNSKEKPRDVAGESAPTYPRLYRGFERLLELGLES